MKMEDMKYPANLYAVILRNSAATSTQPLLETAAQFWAERSKPVLMAGCSTKQSKALCS
jgi:hypothetical protein